MGSNPAGDTIQPISGEVKAKMRDILIKAASEVAGQIDLNGYAGNDAGSVGAALLTKDGNIYTGICLVLACGLGFCAEASAVAEMLKHRETEIEMIVAVTDDGKVIPPCGRCRELLTQVNRGNLNTKVIISRDEIKLLSDLLPDTWADKT